MKPVTKIAIKHWKQNKADKLIALINKLKKIELYLIFIIFLAFLQSISNLHIKFFSLKVTWLFNQLNYENCYQSKPILIKFLFLEL